MEPINFMDFHRFVGIPLEISIRDSEAGDQAPVVKKVVKKVQHCPDGTHIRFYFDDYYFLAVPMESQISQTESEWSAFNYESGLHYTLTKA